MELMYPFVIAICFGIGLAIFFLKFHRNTKYTEGKKVANTKYIKETEYYKAKVKKYKRVTNIIKILSLANIVMASILIARPITIQTKSETKYNRDILLGLDISTSQAEVNLELIENFKKIMPSIQGDRIGIVIFNTAPVVYCPLTEDYDYIYECFATIEAQLKIAIENNGYPPAFYEVDGKQELMIWAGGIATGAELKGSSLVGDGLARNIICFSRFKNKCRKNQNYYFCNRQ